MRAENAKLFRYPNGFEFVFIENRTAPVLAMDLWVRAGSADEIEEEAGLTHLIEHMLFKGTERRSPGAIAREIEGVGGEINAYTSFDHTVYTVLLASRFAGLGLDILSDAVFNSTFNPEELELEKNVVLEEIKRGRDNPHQFLSRMLFSEAFQFHPYGRPVIGNKEVVSAFTSADCLDFLRSRYVPSNMTLVVVGDAAANAIAEEVGKSFGATNHRQARKKRKLPREPLQREFRARFEPKDVSDLYFDLAFPGPTAVHSDVPALDLMVTILGQGEGSRLQHGIKLDQNLVRSIGAGAYTPKYPGLIYVGGLAEPDKFEAAYGALCLELFRLRNERASSLELERAKENVEADFIYQRETVQGQAQKAGYFHVAFGGVAAETDYLEALRRVDAEDVQAVARKYFKASRGTLALLHPQGSQPPMNVEKAGDILAGIEGRRTKIKSHTASKRKTFVRHELANGARIMVKVNSAIPTVAMRAALIGGTRREPEELAGVFHLMANSLAKGSTCRNVFDIAHAIDAVGGQMDGFSGRNSFGLRAEFLTKYLQEGLELFSDILFRPAFPDEEIEKNREDTLAAFNLLKDNPGAYAFRLFEETIYGGHAYGRDVLGTPESISRITSQNVRDVFAAACRPENLAIAVAGDVDPDFVCEFLSRIIESIEPLGQLTPELPSPKAPGKAIFRRASTAAAAEQAHAIIGFLGADIHCPQKYALKVASSILQGQGGRLFRRLRDESGLAYSVSSMSFEGIDPGYFAAYIATSPENVERARKELMEEFHKLTAEEAPLEEVEQAQRKLVGSFEIALQENAVQAAQMSLDDIFGLGFRTFETYAKSVLEVTPADVLSAARRFLKPESHVCLVLGPEGS